MKTSRCFVASLVAVGFFLIAVPAHAQLPIPVPGGSKTLDRLPDDNIEGTIWEYKGTNKSGKILKGRFRLEDQKILDVSRRLPIPTKDEVKEVVEGIKEGKIDEIKLPAAPQVKRIGHYRKLSRSRMRLNFDDKDSLNGIMIIRKKPKTQDIWIGEYSQRDGKKVVAKWDVELRPIED